MLNRKSFTFSRTKPQILATSGKGMFIYNVKLYNTFPQLLFNKNWGYLAVLHKFLEDLQLYSSQETFHHFLTCSPANCDLLQSECTIFVLRQYCQKFQSSSKTRYLAILHVAPLLYCSTYFL